MTEDAASLLARLNGATAEVDTAGLGDSFMLPGDWNRVTEADVDLAIAALDDALRELRPGLEQELPALLV